MKIKCTNHLIHCCLILPTFAAVLLAAPVSAQSQTMTPPAETPPAQTTTPPDRDDDATRRQLANFDSFLDGHPEIAEQLRKDPSLVNNHEYVENHPALQQYLEQHPEIRAEISRNPNEFMREEDRFDRREDRDQGINRRELAETDQFLNQHPEIAEQLRKDPRLIDNKQFVDNHPALQQFLADHPGVRDQFREHPVAFMQDAERFDRREDRDRGLDITRTELANMDRFMDSHPEIAEQLRKDPSLVDNKQFVKNHPALQQFLADHVGVREEYKENPNAFMHDEERFDRREDSYSHGDRDAAGRGLSSFNEFMEGHRDIASELSKTPSLANNQEYLENHPALQDYLKAHPEVHEELSRNPQGFLESAQQFNAHSTQKLATDSKLK